MCNETIKASPCVRNLGVRLDEELKMKEHVSQIIKLAYMHIRKLRVIKKYLSIDSFKTLVNVFNPSRLVNCNSVLFGISDETLSRLQRDKMPLLG